MCNGKLLSSGLPSHAHRSLAEGRFPIHGFAREVSSSRNEHCGKRCTEWESNQGRFVVGLNERRELVLGSKVQTQRFLLLYLLNRVSKSP